jgi:hypothetical protein
MSWSTGPGGSYDHDLGLVAVVVALFGGIDRKAHCFRLALIRSVFFIIELDYPSVAVGLLPLDEVPNIGHVSLLVRSPLFANNAAKTPTELLRALIRFASFPGDRSIFGLCFARR